MLKTENLDVQINDKKILKDINCDFEEWKHYAILWPNWSGKSSLFLSIMWHPQYKVTNWKIMLNSTDLLKLSPDQRAGEWIFLAFQNIPEIPWVKLFEFLKTIYNSKLSSKEQLSFIKFKKHLEPIVEKVWLTKDLLFRDLNVGFSWWERRKVEFLQIELLKPKYIMLDEIDSGLDIDSLKNLWKNIKSLWKEWKTFIIISHNFDIYNEIDLDKILLMKNWEIEKTYNWNMIQKFKEKWFHKTD